jgi:hypothetical protein
VLIFYHEITENGIINYLLKFDWKKPPLQ